MKPAPSLITLLPLSLARALAAVPVDVRQNRIMAPKCVDALHRRGVILDGPQPLVQGTLKL